MFLNVLGADLEEGVLALILDNTRAGVNITFNQTIHYTVKNRHIANNVEAYATQNMSGDQHVTFTDGPRG